MRRALRLERWAFALALLSIMLMGLPFFYNPLAAHLDRSPAVVWLYTVATLSGMGLAFGLTSLASEIRREVSRKWWL